MGCLMANPGMMTSGIAKLLGMSEVYMAAFDRELAKGGLRAKNGRGSSAAKMGSEDATNALLAVLSSGQAREAVLNATTYGGLRAAFARHSLSTPSGLQTWFEYKLPTSSAGLGITIIENLPVGHTAFEMVDALIWAAKADHLHKATAGRTPDSSTNGLRSKNSWEIEIRVMSPQPVIEVTIGCDDQTVTYLYRERDIAPEAGDLRREMRITHNTILGIGTLLRD